MAWKIPERTGTMPPISSVVELAYLIALTPQDWATVILTVIGATSGSAVMLGRYIWRKWETSNARNLAEARRILSEHRIEVDRLQADLKAERDDRAAARERNRIETESLRRENASLHAQVDDKEKIIAERDGTIRIILVALDNKTHTIHELGKDLGTLAHAHLIATGNAKPRPPI